MSTFQRAALFYAERLGLFLVPQWGVENGRCLCGKAKCARPGKHPIFSQWLGKASAQKEVVAQWWEEYPNANIAHVPGRRGLIVIDCDVKNNPYVMDYFKDWLWEQFKLDIVDLGPWSVQTPTGGFHFYFRAPVEPGFQGAEYTTPWTLLNERHGLPPGVEIISGRHLVMLPHSVTPQGTYQWHPEILVKLQKIFKASLTPEEALKELFPLFPAELWEWTWELKKGQRPFSLEEGEPIYEGERHNTLVSIAGALRAKGLTPEEIAAALREINRNRCKPPLPESEVESIARSTQNWPPYPTVTPNNGDSLQQKRPQEEVKITVTPEELYDPIASQLRPKLEEQMARLLAGQIHLVVPLLVGSYQMEAGHLARVFAPVLEPWFRYTTEADWFHYSEEEARWVPDQEALRLQQWLLVLIQMFTVRLLQEHPEMEGALRKFNRRYSNPAGLGQLIKMLQGELFIPITVFDADPDVIHCASGIVDLRTGQLIPAEPQHYARKKVQANYLGSVDWTQACPRWLAFLDKITLKREELKEYLQVLLGYALTGRVSEQAVFFLWGTGANGKSTLMTTVADIMNDYARILPAEGLLVGGRENPMFARAELFGVRLAIFHETEEGAVLMSAQLKQLVSSEKISARFIYHRSFEFSPTHKIVMMTNHPPQVKDLSEGTWRRLRLIPFEYVFRKEEIIPDFHEVLLEERDAIFSWMVEGAKKWYENRFPSCSVVEEAVKSYRMDQDVLLEWLSECCDLSDPKAMTPMSQLYENYREWCQAHGEEPVPQNVFGRLLTKRNILACKWQGQRARRGIKLRGQDKTVVTETLLDELGDVTT